MYISSLKKLTKAWKMLLPGKVCSKQANKLLLPSSMLSWVQTLLKTGKYPRKHENLKSNMELVWATFKSWKTISPHLPLQQPLAVWLDNGKPPKPARDARELLTPAPESRCQRALERALRLKRSILCPVCPWKESESRWPRKNCASPERNCDGGDYNEEGKRSKKEEENARGGFSEYKSWMTTIIHH